MSDNPRVDDDHEAIERLFIGNADLERLGALAEEFNIFVAIGAQRREQRHSDFLAFLFDPQQPHGLGDAFAKQLLERVLSTDKARSLRASAMDFDLWSLEHAMVLREWHKIDLLVVDHSHRLVIVIENKIDSGEESGQLTQYYRLIEQQYRSPRWQKVFLFLTPHGDAPSDDHYLAVDYSVIHDVVDGFVEDGSFGLPPDVRTLMRHYVRMLRRHIMGKSDISDLCRRLYHEHKRAVDLFEQHRNDHLPELSAFLQKLIAQTSGVELDDWDQTYIRFRPKEWNVASLRKANWTGSDIILLFEIQNRETSLELLLLIGHGDPKTKKKLFAMAHEKDAFCVYTKDVTQYCRIFERPLLARDEYADRVDQLQQTIRSRWQEFVDNDLPSIRQAVRETPWIWQDGGDLGIS